MTGSNVESRRCRTFNTAKMDLAISFTTVFHQFISEEHVQRSRAVFSRLKRRSNDARKTEQETATINRRMSSQCGCKEGASSGNCQPSCATTVKNTLNQPAYDVFLGGSCGNTVWRSQLVIPFLKKRAISYYDPQRSVWSENLIYEESIAKENSSLFLFVLDPATINATSFLEIAYFAARKSPKLVVVFLGRAEWREKAHPEDLKDRMTTCKLLDRILEAHQVPLFQNIEEALTYIESEIIGCKHWTEALAHPSQRLTFLGLRTKLAARVAGMSAKMAWVRFRHTASKLAVAGAADAVVLVAGQFVAPALPLYFIIIPLIVLNVLFIAAHSVWSRAQARRPRGIVDSRMIPLRATTSIPIPRMSTVTTPLIKRTSPSQVRQSKRWCESLVNGAGVPPVDEPPAWRRVSQDDKRRTPALCFDKSAHVFIACSSVEQTELEWVTQMVAPYLQKNDIGFSTVLAAGDSVPAESRMTLLKKGARGYRQVLYHIPTTKTFLSGMVEIAYLLGHADWHVTVCVSKDAEQLDCALLNQEEEAERAARRRRNDCYAIAYCYLKDMAKRRQCRVFCDLNEALAHCVKLANSDGC